MKRSHFLKLCLNLKVFITADTIPTYPLSRCLFVSPQLRVQVAQKRSNRRKVPTRTMNKSNSKPNWRSRTKRTRGKDKGAKILDAHDWAVLKTRMTGFEVKSVAHENLNIILFWIFWASTFLSTVTAVLIVYLCMSWQAHIFFYCL